MSGITRDITIEKKLELMRQIRSRNERDRFDMSRREQIIYGKSMGTTSGTFSVDMDADDEEELMSTFALRILLATALLIFVIMCDLSGKSFMGITSTQCFTAIGKDYESSILAWVDAASENTVSENIEENPPAGNRP